MAIVYRFIVRAIWVRLPAEAYISFCKILFETNENLQKEAGFHLYKNV